MVLCPICRQLLAPAPPGWSSPQTGLPTGWDCPNAHALSTPPALYDAARLAWLAHDLSLHPGMGQEPCGPADRPPAQAEVTPAGRTPPDLAVAKEGGRDAGAEQVPRRVQAAGRVAGG